MKTILVINDSSLESAHAARFAMLIGQKMQADILLANCEDRVPKLIERSVHGCMQKNTAVTKVRHALQTDILLLDQPPSGFTSAVKEVDVAGKDETALAALIHKNQVWLIISGICDGASDGLISAKLRMDAILRRVCCPLLLIPLKWSIKDIERLIYITDLRYCRAQIIRFMAGLAEPWDADVSVAHICATGLPEFNEDYAQNTFTNDVRSYTPYKRLFFSHVKEHDVNKAVDVMINGMNNDIMVLVNRQFHFKTVIGIQIEKVLPASITIPLLIFP